MKSLRVLDQVGLPHNHTREGYFAIVLPASRQLLSANRNIYAEATGILPIVGSGVSAEPEVAGILRGSAVYAGDSYGIVSSMT